MMRLDATWENNGPYVLTATTLHADGTDTNRRALVMTSPHREHIVAHMDALVADFPYYEIGTYPREHDGISGPCHGEPGIAHRACLGYAEGFYGQIDHPCQCTCHPVPFSGEDWHNWLHAARPIIGDQVVRRSRLDGHIVRTHEIVVAIAKDKESILVLRANGTTERLGQDPKTGLFVDTAGAFAEFFNPDGKRPGRDDALPGGTAAIVLDTGTVTDLGLSVLKISATGKVVTVGVRTSDGGFDTWRAYRHSDGSYWAGAKRIVFNVAR